MSDLQELDAAIATTAPADVDAHVDRRRPDRLPTVSPALLPLLRTPEQMPESAPPPETLPEFRNDLHFSEPDDGDPARGIMFAILFSLPVWAVILYLVL